MDQIDKTIDFLKETLLDDPDNMDLRLKLASSYMTKQEVDKARKQIDLILKKDPKNQQALTFLSTLKQTQADTLDNIVEQEPTEEDELASPPQAERVAVTPEAQPPEAEKEYMKSWFEEAHTHFEDVGGMADLKEEIRISIVYPFERPELYEKYGKKIGGGLLLYGPPGCGKTHIARATAGEIQAMFLSIAIDDILDMWMGSSEKKMHALFQTAREVCPTVIFIDEVDALGMDRMKTSNSASMLVNQFLTEMDGINSNNDKIMVIGATNAPWQVEPALRRPGRFDKIVFVPPPDELARAEIFKIHLQDKPVDHIDYIELAKRTRTFSGADIYSVCDQAAEKVLREVMSSGKDRNIQMDDLLGVVQQTQSSVREWFSTAKNFARYANESGTYSPILQYIKENKLE